MWWQACDSTEFPVLSARFEALMLEHGYYDLLETENGEYRRSRTDAEETTEHRLRIRQHDWTAKIVVTLILCGGIFVFRIEWGLLKW